MAAINVALVAPFYVADVDGDNEVFDTQPDVTVAMVGAGNFTGLVTLGGVEQNISTWSTSSIVLSNIDATGLLLGPQLLKVFKPVVAVNEYYVKTGGDDGLDGLSDATAWATTDKVESSVTAGDVIYFRSQDSWTSASLPVLNAVEGVVYDGASYGIGTRAKIVTGAVMGIPNWSAVSISFSSVTFRGFEIDGNDISAYGIYVGEDVSTDIENIVLDDLLVHNVGDPNNVDYVYGIHVASKASPPRTLRNISILNSVVHTTIHEGIALYQSWGVPGNKTDGVLVRNCEVYNTGYDTPGLSGVGVLIANYTHNVTVEFCNIHGNSAHGVWIRTSPGGEGINGGPHGFVVRHNLIQGNSVTGVSFQTGNGQSMSGAIYSNLIINSGIMDILVDNGDYPESVFEIYNNTLYNTASATGFGVVSIMPYSGEYTQPPTLIFKNNIAHSAVRPFYDKDGLIDHSNNLFFRSSGAGDSHVFDDGVSYTRTEVATWDATAKSSDPAFTGGTLPSGFAGSFGVDMLPNTDYFAISSGDAIDTGANLGSPYDACINGAGLAVKITRPQGVAYDMGAYEYVP